MKKVKKIKNPQKKTKNDVPLKQEADKLEKPNLGKIKKGIKNRDINGDE
jgi:hypothetical protein